MSISIGVFKLRVLQKQTAITNYQFSQFETLTISVDYLTHFSNGNSPNLTFFSKDKCYKKNSVKQLLLELG
jgi:hypothetical protein